MSFYLSRRRRHPFKTIPPGEVYLALLLVSLCSCPACRGIVRHSRAGLREVFDGDLLPLRKLLGPDRVREQGVGYTDGGPHVCLRRPRGGEGGAA